MAISRGKAGAVPKTVRSQAFSGTGRTAPRSSGTAKTPARGQVMDLPGRGKNGNSTGKC